MTDDDFDGSSTSTLVQQVRQVVGALQLSLNLTELSNRRLQTGTS